MNRQELIREQWEFDGEIGSLVNQPKITAPIPPYSSPEIPDNAIFWAVEIGLKCCNNPKRNGFIAGLSQMSIFLICSTILRLRPLTTTKRSGSIFTSLQR